jgi:hypothetical protein
MTGHRIRVRVYQYAFGNKECMVPGGFTPDFRVKEFKVFGYSEDSGNENKWEKGLQSLPSSNLACKPRRLFSE